MNDQINNGKGFLKDKLGGYQADPPEQVWNSISAGLGGRSRRRMIIITLSAAATIALAITLGINYFGPEQTDTTGIAETQRQAPQTPGIESMPETESGSDHTPIVARETLEDRVVRTMEEVAEEPIMGEPTQEVLAVSQEALAVSQEVLAVSQEVLVVSQEAPVESTEVIAEAPAEPAEEQAQVLVDEPSEDPGDELPLDPFPVIEDEGKRDPRWIIGASLSPLYSFRDAESAVIGNTAEHESGLVSYAGGVHVAYRTTSRLAIESGVFFNKMGISIGSPGIQLANRSYDFAPLGAEVASSNVVAISNSVGNIVSKSGDIYVNSYKLDASYADNTIEEYTSSEVFADQGIRQHLDYLEVPFNLRYTLIDRSIEVQLVGGMSTNLLVNNYVTMETAEGHVDIGYLTNIRNVNYSGNAGLGMVYHIQEQFSLRLEPRFRYFLNSINDTSLPSTRPYAFGIFTGLSYRF